MPNWFTYDWQVRGAPAEFTVDLSFGEAAEGLPAADYGLLAYCAAAPMEKGRPFAGGELSRLARLEGKLLRALPDSCYAGQIHMESLHQYYFYLPQDAERLAAEALDAAAFKERKLHLHHGFSPEPDWLTYRELLYPDAAKFQTEVNRQLLERQRKLGDALEKVRRITLLLCFASEQDKLFFREAARQNGFAIGEDDFQPELERPHLLELYCLTALEKQPLDDITTRTIRMAAPYGGELIRWTTPRLAKKNPLS